MVDGIIVNSDKNLNYDKTQNKITSFFCKNNSDEKKINKKFIPDYYVYTDGACSNNGKNNALAGIGIFFGINDIRNVSKKIKENKQIIQQN